ncbi:MAG: TetR/AcrR family transcriptional regulator [Bacilli bacterium]|nr:TetR/AcrR family transcriptional regulator [Bacilli bacterium]
MKKSKEKTSKDLICLALYQLLHTMTYDEISVKDICDKAGVSRMSFYRKYNKKDDIFIDFCDEQFAKFYDEINIQNISTGYDFVLSLFKFIMKFDRQLIVMKKAGKLDLLQDQLANYGKYILVRLDHAEVAYLKENPLTIPFLSGGAYNIIKKWIDEGFNNTPEQMTNWVLHLFDS